MKLSGWMMGAAAIALAAACNKAPAPLTDAERTALADSVGQIATQWMATFVTQPTVEKYLSHYVHGNDLVHAEYGMIYPTYDSLVAGARAFFKTVSSMNFTLDQKRFTVLDRDVVVMTAMVKGTMKDSAGKESPPSQEAWTAVWHRTSDGWKIAADHESMAPPAPLAPPKPERRTR
jgi:ketosteroid isomerase-like protein